MTYVIDCYFRQSWKDSRLAYKSMPNFQNSNNSQNDLHNEKKTSSAQNTSQNALALSIYMLEKIWRPSTYFHSEFLILCDTFLKIVYKHRQSSVTYTHDHTAKQVCSNL